MNGAYLVRTLLVTQLIVLACGCVSVEWSRDSRQSPPPPQATSVLIEGRSSLAETLDLMGAPLDVYEYRQTSVALAYGLYGSDSKGIRVSVPVYQQVSASVSMAPPSFMLVR